MSDQPTEELDNTPDTKKFDVSKWLAKGKAGRVTKTVTVYNDLSLLDEAKQVAVEIAKHNETVEPNNEDLAMGEKSRSSELEERQAEIEQRIKESEAEIVVTSLSPAEAAALVEDYQDHFGADHHPDQEYQGNFWRLERSATLNGQKLTAAEWQEVSELIAGGQWRLVVDALVWAQTHTPRVDPRFLGNGSRLSTAVTHR